MLNLYLDSSLGLSSSIANQLKAMYNGPIAFFAIAGIQQILVSVGLILLLLDVIGSSSKHIWVRIIVAVLIFDFGFNFCIAVSAANYVTIAKQMWDIYLSATADYINSLSGLNKKLYQTIFAIYGLEIAETVLTFIVAIPIIVINIIALIDTSLLYEDS